MNQINEIQIQIVKPKDGLVGFASCVLNNNLYLGSIAIYTRLNGGYRLTFPTKKVASQSLPVFYPINRQFSYEIENKIIDEFVRITSKPEQVINY